MNENAEKWVEALESGEYKQGANKLVQEVEDGELLYCCLGVGCELYAQEFPNRLVRSGDSDHGLVFRYPGSSLSYPTQLPGEVMEWLGLNAPNGAYAGGCLANDNDSGLNFKQIADIIRAKPKKLFNDEAR